MRTKGTHVNLTNFILGPSISWKWIFERDTPIPMITMELQMGLKCMYQKVLSFLQCLFQQDYMSFQNLGIPNIFCLAYSDFDPRHQTLRNYIYSPNINECFNIEWKLNSVMTIILSIINISRYAKIIYIAWNVRSLHIFPKTLNW